LSPAAASQKEAGLRAELDALFLESGDVFFAPIRHHSPACAEALLALCDELRPKTILVEGPADLTPQIEMMLNEKTKTPFAAYLTYVDRRRRLESASAEPARLAGYYPLCDYSPELVVLRRGQELGAKLAFIDLTFPQRVIAGRARGQADRVALLAEAHLAHSRYVDALCRRSGCRDADELWDQLFECGAAPQAPRAYFRDVAAYCALARRDYPEDALRVDGTLAREDAMAAAIARASEDTADLPVLVVTGGFHTLPIWRRLNQKTAPKPPKELALAEDEALAVLMRYSFAQLDALNGYAAGMPSPGFYERVWAAGRDGDVSSELIVEIGRASRADANRDVEAAGCADEIAALTQAQGLARMRGHHRPTRMDVLDGLRSAFFRGPVDEQGPRWAKVIDPLMRGSRVGHVPPEAGSPPLVRDFHRRLRALRFKLQGDQKRDKTLDLYRKQSHRVASRLLHGLTFLEVPFADLYAGPDFVFGRDLDRLNEKWRYLWTPDVEAALIERAVFGETLPRAMLARLLQLIARLPGSAGDRDASRAVSLLVHACRMGLQRHVDRLMTYLLTALGEDPSLVSLEQALRQLVLLRRSREPLEAFALEGLPRLICVAFQRGCYHVRSPGVGDDGLQQVDAMLSLWSMAADAPLAAAAGLDAELLDGALSACYRATEQSNPLIAGAAAGLRYRGQRLGAERLARDVAGRLLGVNAARADHAAAFLRGLLRCGRAALWQVPGIIAAIDTALCRWSEEQFLEVLPELRLAFADLSPREIDRVTRRVCATDGDTREPAPAVGDLADFDRQARLCLSRDHLGHWLDSSPDTLGGRDG